MAQIRCPAGFYEEIIAGFWMKNLKLTPKMTKNQKTPDFYRFYALFVKVLTDFVNCNVETGQQGKNGLSSRLFRIVYCCFLSKIVSNFKNFVSPKMTKIQILS